MRITIISISILFLLLLWSFFIEPNIIKITKFQLEDEQMPKMRIALLGDLHIKPSQAKKLDKIVELVNTQNPDLVLSVGDYASGHKQKSTLPVNIIVQKLSKVKSKYGFYTVLGNHDWWINGEEFIQDFNKNGIKVLTNSNLPVKIGDKTIWIAGVEDLQTRTPDISKALSGTKNPVILLSHSPDEFPLVPQSVNLTLAGHVHGGQIRIPLYGAIILPSSYGEKYSHGLIIENNKKMIVTKGIGTSILPFRFNCFPEIVIIDFI